MAFPRVLLPLALALLMIDAIIELSFVSSMVAWLHRTAGGDFTVVAPSTSNELSFSLHGKPEGLLINQGHTSNAAAGTAFVLVGLGGILALTLRYRAMTNGRVSLVLYHAWLVSTILSVLLTLVALIYTFVVTNAHTGQTIDLDVAVSLDNRPYPNFVAYPLGQWTPENWFSAILELQLVDPDQRNDIANHLTIMRAWKWNLIPLFILGLGFSIVAIMDALIRRRSKNSNIRVEQYKPERRGS
ncbi:hypothetical protein Q7P37_003952 [Cladosporium fusiforme]